MTDLVSALNHEAPFLRAINSSISNVVVSTTTETVFNQIWKFPDQSQHNFTAPTLVRISACGLVSTALVAPSLTLAVRWGGISGTVVCSTGVFSTTSSLTDAGWELDVSLLITSLGTSGTMESQGILSMQSGLLTLLSNFMTSTSTVTFNSQTAADVVVTTKWGTSSASNSIQLKTLVCEVDGP